jgi:copper chaperone CopZ
MAKQQVLMVDGMTCVGCERRIISALGDIAGVAEASADHSTGRVTLAVDSDFAGTGAVSRTIEDLGYELVTE